MKSCISGLMLMISVLAYTQTQRFIYEVKSKKDSTNQTLTTELYHLDIGPEETLYYSRDYFLLDSVMSNNLPMTLLGEVPNISDVITHQKNSKRYTTYEVREYDAYKMETEDAQNWKLSTEKKKIDQYQVQKATSRWGGRNWTAWFSTEIPFSDGPCKFSGLPGLIMELSDDRGNYEFQIVKSEKLAPKSNPQSLFDFMMKSAVPVTPEKYRKMKLSHYQDPLSFLKIKMSDFEFTEDNWAMLKDGTKVTGKNQKEVIAQQQQRLRKYNNPVELDKAIRYPEK